MFEKLKKEDVLEVFKKMLERLNPKESFVIEKE